jgi:hypothetical protein
MFNTFGGNIPSGVSGIGDMLAVQLAYLDRFNQQKRAANGSYGGYSDYDNQIVTSPIIPNIPISKIIESMMAQRGGQRQQQPEPEAKPKIPWADMSSLAPDVQSLPGAARAWSGSPLSYTMYGGR